MQSIEWPASAAKQTMLPATMAFMLDDTVKVLSYKT